MRIGSKRLNLGRIVSGRDDMVTQVYRTMHKNLLVSKFRWIAENRAFLKMSIGAVKPKVKTHVKHQQLPVHFKEHAKATTVMAREFPPPR